MPLEHRTSQETNIQVLQQLFEETDDWLGDLSFRSDEIRFYWKVARQYLKSIDPETTDRVESVKKQLARLEAENQALDADVLSYRKHLNQRMKVLNAGGGDQEAVTEMHTDMQTKMHELDGAFRNFKDEVFGIANDVFGE